MLICTNKEKCTGIEYCGGCTHNGSPCEFAKNIEDIKFYYNGLKVDGGKLIKAWYSIDNNKDHAPSVSISCKEYGGNLPACLNPKNDTDLMTDYFDKDRAYLTPDSPYYTAARIAGLEWDLRSINKSREREVAYLAKCAEFNRKPADPDALNRLNKRSDAIVAELIGLGVKVQC